MSVTAGALVVIVAAVVASVVPLPVGVRDLLEVVAGAVTVGAVARRWGRGPFDGLLIGAAGVLVALVLLGLLLEISPGGLGRSGWAVAVGVAEAVTILYLRPVVSRLPRVRIPAGFGWFVAGAAVVAGGLAASVVATGHADEAPLALSAAPFDGTTAVVSVTAGAPSRPLDLVESVAGTDRTVLDAFRVSPGHARTVTVGVPPGQRVVLKLISGGVTERTVILGR